MKRRRSPVGLVMVAGAARSGTTLLRVLMDAHPAVGAPAEAGIPALVAQLARVWTIVGGGTPESELQLTRSSRLAIRRAALEPMSSYCLPRNKRIYCDKSLDSVFHLEAVHQVFPAARCIFLVRHVMDVVASALDASPWGFNAYGFQPFVQQSPDNFVAALAQYWRTHVEAMLRWEATHGERCLRIRYEDFVAEPDHTMKVVCGFIGVPHDPELIPRALRNRPVDEGPGDHKLAHTEAISASSVGTGKRVPLALIAPALREALDADLAALGYGPLGTDWSVPTEGQATPRDERPGGLTNVMSELALSRNGYRRRFALIADDFAQERWIVDPRGGSIRNGDGKVAFAITGSADDLVRMIRGSENAGALLRHGRLRYVRSGTRQPSFGEASSALREATSVLREAAAAASAIQPRDGTKRPDGPTDDQPRTNGNVNT